MKVDVDIENIKKMKAIKKKEDYLYNSFIIIGSDKDEVHYYLMEFIKDMKLSKAIILNSTAKIEHCKNIYPDLKKISMNKLEKFNTIIIEDAKILSHGKLKTIHYYMNWGIRDIILTVSSLDEIRTQNIKHAKILYPVSMGKFISSKSNEIEFIAVTGKENLIERIKDDYFRDFFKDIKLSLDKEIGLNTYLIFAERVSNYVISELIDNTLINGRVVLAAKKDIENRFLVDFSDEVIIELENFDKIVFSDYNMIIISDIWELLSNANKEQFAKIVALMNDKSKKVIATTTRIDFDTLGVNFDLRKQHELLSLRNGGLKFYTIV